MPMKTFFSGIIKTEDDFPFIVKTKAESVDL